MYNEKIIMTIFAFKFYQLNIKVVETLFDWLKYEQIAILCMLAGDMDRQFHYIAVYKKQQYGIE